MALVRRLAAASLVALAAGATAPFHAHAAAGGGDSKVVARVNGERVTQAEVQRLLVNPAVRAELEQELGAGERDAKALPRLALDKLIGQRLLLQEARRRNLRVTDKESDDALLKLRRRFRDLKEFGAWMHERGLDDRSLFETIRNELLIKRVAAALIEGVKLSENQIRAYYEAHKHEQQTSGAVHLRVIAVRDRAVADDIVLAAKNGADFGKLAREKSIGRRAAKGGDTEWMSRDRLPPLLRQALGRAKLGEVVGPIPAGNDFRVVQLVAARSPEPKSLAEVRPRIERRLLLETQKDFLAAWRREQEKRSKVELLD